MKDKEVRKVLEDAGIARFYTLFSPTVLVTFEDIKKDYIKLISLEIENRQNRKKIEELTNKLDVLLSYIGVKLEEVPPSDVKYKVVPIKDEK